MPSDGGRRPGRLVAAALAAAALGGGVWLAAGGRPDHAAAPADQPSAAIADEPALRLVVLVVIDQLPSWTFARDRELLSGGLGRVLREGLVIPEAEYPYAATYTAPGHAAIGTGAPPAVSGILANEWYRRDERRSLTATEDEAAPIFAVGDREPSEGGASPRRLAVHGVADALREATGGEARSISIAVKPRAAIFAAGKRPDLAVWYDPSQRAMTTSAYYTDELPDWLADLHARHPVEERFGDRWDPLDADLLAEITGRPDDGVGEGDVRGFLGDTFPHRLDATYAAPKAIRLTPSAAEMVVTTARAAIEAEDLGGDDVADFLSISFGCHDYAGHFWGQESWERLDLLLRIDRMLGSLFEELDAALGPDGYAVVVTSDHGAAPLVDASPADDARRIDPRAVTEAADEALDAVLGPGDHIEIRSASTLYIRGLDDVSDEDRDRALDAAVDAVRDLEGIGYAARADALRGDCDTMDGLDALACRSLGDDLGDIVHFPAPYSLITSTPFGTTHGSPYDYDRRVPIAVRAPGWDPGVVDERVSMLRVAPTLTALLGAERLPHAPEPIAPR